MLNIVLIIRLVLPLYLHPAEICQEVQDIDIRSIYYETGVNNVLSFDVFELAMKGLQKTDQVHDKTIITIIDYSEPSSQERFFVIDLVNKHILYKTLVAHGRNSGEEKAVSFSNDAASLKSSLGFYVTAETYNGKHGYSLCLDGLEPGINDNARARSIVIHGADYVSTGFIENYGRLGRSWGCPALPLDVYKEIIDRISNGSCIFIYGIDPEYIKKSKIINE